MFCLLACSTSIAGNGDRNSFKELSENWLQSNDNSSSSGSPQLRGAIDGETSKDDPKIGDTPITDALLLPVFLSLIYMSVKSSHLRRLGRVKN
jgi:hypothetical protein